MKKATYYLKKILEMIQKVPTHHVAAYASQSAFFFILSLIPMILLLMTFVQYTPVTKADVMTAVIQIFPGNINILITSIVNQVYNQSMEIIPITLLVALWSAGKGVLALATGLNTIFGCPETRNYVYIRMRATVYTILFVMALIVMLVIAVFGNTINDMLFDKFPLLSDIARWILWIKNIVAPTLLTILFVYVYKYLPNSDEITIKEQLPGAVFAAMGWMVCSWVFSIYLDVFQGFSNMYGSLTTIILIMLWMYFTMYCILLGGEINEMIKDIKRKD